MGALLVARVLTASLLLAVIGAWAPAAPASAQEMPALPEPVPVSLDSGTTAFLVLDILSSNCPRRPTCMASLSPISSFLNQARDAGVLVVFSSGTAPPTFFPEVTPNPDEPVVSSRADKFYDTHLDDILREHGIETVVMVGSASNGAVLYTAFGASERGYTVVVAQDGISADNDHEDYLARYQLLKQPGFANVDNEPLQEQAVTLSRTDLITFK